jgi:RNA polymerase sigma factor (TIGR02999 family)
MNEDPQITQILQEIAQGNRTRINQLIPLVYDELHGIAEKQMYGEHRLMTINPTALAHEAYLKLVNQQDVRWNDRCHFFAIAAQSMRRIIIDYARFKHAQKRGGEKITLTFADENLMQEIPADDLLALNEALERLGELNHRQYKVIEYWFFGGLTHDEIANVLNISVPSVRRDWRLARAWLSRELKSIA